MYYKSRICVRAFFIAVIALNIYFISYAGHVSAEDDFFETKVQKILSGDRIMLPGGTIVQYHGIEVAPLNDPREKVVQLSRRALQENERLVKDKTIRVEFVELDDISSVKHAYVFASGVMLNGYLLKNGYALVRQDYGRKEKYYSYFVMAQASAARSKKGLWGLS